MIKAFAYLVLITLFMPVIYGQSIHSGSNGDAQKYLNIPERCSSAAGGSEFAAQAAGWSVQEREAAVVREILSGNVPSFSRTFKAVRIPHRVKGETHELIYFVTCDYLAVGSDQDYLYIPLTPATAQFLADRLNCSLPTSKIVDQIYEYAEARLTPQPIPPSDTMTTIPVFEQHTDSIRLQFALRGTDRPLDALIAGHKKDIIVSNNIYSPDRDFDRVVIYGWHKGENDPIQGVYNGHIAGYADYSHGVRFISQSTILNGDTIPFRAILRDPDLSGLLSSEGVIDKPCYPASE